MKIDSTEQKKFTCTIPPWPSYPVRLGIAAATIGLLLGVAAMGDFLKSDVVVYLSIAIIAGVFSSGVRSAFLGAFVAVCTVLFAMLLGSVARGPNEHLHQAWTSAALLFVAAILMRVRTRATLLSLLGSLVLIEAILVAVIAYKNASPPTLFHAFSAEHRPGVWMELRLYFPQQRWYIAVPWLAGIAIGEILVFRRSRKSKFEKPSSQLPQEL